MRDLFAPSRRAFSGFGSFYALRPIDPRGLAGRASPTGSHADGVRGRRARRCERIVELGGGHPRATMRIAQQTHLVSLELDTREIDLDLVQVGFERALEGDRPTMEQIVERDPAAAQARAAGGADRSPPGSRFRGGSSPGFATVCSSCSATPAFWSTSRAASGAVIDPLLRALPRVARPARLDL